MPAATTAEIPAWGVSLPFMAAPAIESPPETTAVITAAIDGRSATASVVVRLMPVARVTVTPADVQIDAGKSVTLTARVYDANGNILTGRPVVWSSSDTRIVTVDQSGVARGVRRGSSVVTATVEGKFGTATVRVD